MVKSESVESTATLHVSRSAERALALLDTVVQAGSVSLGEAATATDLPASTALRHLRALVSSGWLSRDDVGRYSGGPTLLRVALGAFRSGPYARLATAAQTHLERLVDATEESAYLSVRDGSDAVYIATVEGTRAIRHVGWVGRSAPIATTAVGAALTGEALTPGDPPIIQFKTGAIEPDISAVVAPVYGRDRVLGALSILGPAERIVDERLAIATEQIKRAAQALSLELSFDDKLGGGSD